MTSRIWPGSCGHVFFPHVLTVILKLASLRTLNGLLEDVMMKLRRVDVVVLAVVRRMHGHTFAFLSLKALVLVWVCIRCFATLCSMPDLQAPPALMDERRVSRTTIASLGILAFTPLKLLAKLLVVAIVGEKARGRILGWPSHFSFSGLLVLLPVLVLGFA